MRESEMRSIVQRLHWLVKARRSTGTSTTQVRAHIAHDAHGGVHLVGAHTRHFNARDAFKLGTKALREHVAAGGEAGAVAQAEIDRRAEKRGGARADTVALAPKAAATPRRARKLKAEEPASTLPAWVPKPKRGGRYTKAELPSVRQAVRGNPEVHQLQAEWTEVGREMERQGVSSQRARSVTSSQEAFAAEQAGWFVGDYHWPNLTHQGLNPSKLADHWRENWTRHVDREHAGMRFWRQHGRVLLDPDAPIDSVMAALQVGTAEHHIGPTRAIWILRDIHGQNFVSKTESNNWIPDHETRITDLIIYMSHKPKVTIHEARQKAVDAKAAEQAKQADNSDLWHDAATQVAAAMNALREAGRSPSHTPNLRRAIPGIEAKVETYGKPGGARNYEVVLTGGPWQGFRFVGPRASTREEAWTLAEEHMKTIAAMPKGQHWTTYSRARPMGKARMRSIVQRLHWLVKAARYVYEPEAPANAAGWEPPTAKRKTWRWDTQLHGGPPPAAAKKPRKPRGKKGAPAVEPVATAPHPPVAPTIHKTTLQWRGDVSGRTKGEIRKLDDRWVVYTKVGKAKTRRLSSMDEDMGHGQEGDRMTYQDVEYRHATPDEVAREEKRIADKKKAEADAHPRGRWDAWKVEHPDAVSHPEHQPPPGVVWTPVGGTVNGQAFATGIGPDGSQWARFQTSSYDDWRESFMRTPPDPALAAAVAQRFATGRATLERIAETGTYTDEDLAHLDEDLRVELMNNRFGEGYTDGRPNMTRDDALQSVLNDVRGSFATFGPMPGVSRDLGFEMRAVKNEYGRAAMYSDHALGQIEALADIPAAYQPLIDQRIAEGRAAQVERNAAEQAKQQAMMAQQAEIASARRRGGGSYRGSYAKLRDGSWGGRVSGTPEVGDTVTLTTRSGKTEKHRVRRVVHSDGDYSLVALEKALSTTALLAAMADAVAALTEV